MSEFLDENPSVRSFYSEETLKRMHQKMLEGILESTINHIKVLEMKKNLIL